VELLAPLEAQSDRTAITVPPIHRKLETPDQLRMHSICLRDFRDIENYKRR
jgi:hypothetical protein